MSESQHTDNSTRASSNLPETSPDPGRSPWIRCLMQVLWPAFMGAGITVGLLFSFIDPLQIEWVHVHLNDSRQASYTLGFLLLWVLYAMACSITWYLASTETPKR